jgi:prevent-host-death family protein
MHDRVATPYRRGFSFIHSVECLHSYPPGQKATPMDVSTLEAKNRLRALLTEVARGAEITITRRGVPVAKLVPVGPTFDRTKAQRAAAGLRDASRGATLGGIKIKDLVDEGRS